MARDYVVTISSKVTLDDDADKDDYGFEDLLQTAMERKVEMGTYSLDYYAEVKPEGNTP